MWLLLLTKRNYWLPQDNDGDLPFQCILKAWMSKYSLPRYSHSVGDLLPGTTLYWIWIWIWISPRLEANTLFGRGWDLLDGSFTDKRRRTRSQFELVHTPCHVLQGQHTHLCYSLVVGLAPLGPSLG